MVLYLLNAISYAQNNIKYKNFNQFLFIFENKRIVLKINNATNLFSVEYFEKSAYYFDFQNVFRLSFEINKFFLI